MDVILTRFCFYDLYSLILTQLSYHLSDILSYLSVDDLSPIFGRKYYSIMDYNFGTFQRRGIMEQNLLPR